MSELSKIIRDLRSDDPALRHAAALKAADSGLGELAPVLLERSLEPKMIGWNGTLIYALGHFDCSRYFAQLAEVAVSHGYEAAWGSMSIIDEQEIQPTREELEGAKAIMKRAKKEGLSDDQEEAWGMIEGRYFPDDPA